MLSGDANNVRRCGDSRLPQAEAWASESVRRALAPCLHLQGRHLLLEDGRRDEAQEEPRRSQDDEQVVQVAHHGDEVGHDVQGHGQVEDDGGQNSPGPQRHPAVGEQPPGEARLPSQREGSDPSRQAAHVCVAQRRPSAPQEDRQGPGREESRPEDGRWYYPDKAHRSIRKPPPGLMLVEVTSDTSNNLSSEGQA